jgi:hypothetical protein
MNQEAKRLKGTTAQNHRWVHFYPEERIRNNMKYEFISQSNGTRAVYSIDF